MRIGLDLTALKGRELGGMASQAWWLARWMPELAPEDEFVFFLPPGTEPPSAATNVSVVPVAWPNLRGARFVTEQLLLPLAAARQRLDILHTIAFGPPVLYRGRKLLTIHDLGFRILPDTVPPRYARYWNWAYGPAARDCRQLIAVSEATRRDVVRLLGRDPSAVSVVHPGVDPMYFESAEAGPPPVGVTPPYLLHVGVLQPRKDIETLLDTFARIQRSRPELRLVVCGPPGWGYPDLGELTARHGVSGRVDFISGVARERMPALYAGGSLFLFTSLHEGFGLPLVEAMAAGLPVVATNNSAIPEVTGNAARLAPTRDAAALARAALELLDDPILREEAVRRGRERAQSFSWRRCAENTLAVYRQVLAS